MPYSLSFSSFLLLFCFLNHKSVAQERQADSIFTARKDTMIVKIIEVGVDSVKYYKMKELQNMHSLAKSNISKIIYGNGETEMFSKIIPNKYQIIPGSDSKYYRMTLPTPFQKSIAQWSTEKLIFEEKRVKENRNLCVIMGIFGFVGGTVTGIAGLAKIFDSPNSASSLMATGLVIGLSGIPLVIFGGLNNKKAKFIRMELGRRGVGN